MIRREFTFAGAQGFLWLILLGSLPADSQAINLLRCYPTELV